MVSNAFNKSKNKPSVFFFSSIFSIILSFIRKSACSVDLSKSVLSMDYPFVQGKKSLKSAVEQFFQNLGNNEKHGCNFGDYSRLHPWKLDGPLLYLVQQGRYHFQAWYLWCHIRHKKVIEARTWTGLNSLGPAATKREYTNKWWWYIFSYPHNVPRLTTESKITDKGKKSLSEHSRGPKLDSCRKSQLKIL